jgi:1-deoxy-D-xylulose-5-phosphate synthase
VTLLSYGILVNETLQAATLLEQRGISAEVVKLNQISPLDGDMLAEFIGNTDFLLIVEDSFGAGCVGQRIAAILAEHGAVPKKLILKNLGRTFAPEGSVAQLKHSFGLDAEGIVQAVMEGRGE